MRSFLSSIAASGASNLYCKALGSEVADMGKKLAIFCDGTWNEASLKERTNVARLFEATTNNDGNRSHQLTHYVRGVGTTRAEKFIGGATGYGISDNIKNAYSFLVATFSCLDLAAEPTQPGALRALSGTSEY